MKADPCCPSCGLPYVIHVSFVEMCQKLRDATKENTKLRRQLARARKAARR